MAYQPRVNTAWRAGFDKVTSSGSVDTDDFTIVGSVGTGHAIQQTGGNLVITSGTTARSEVIARSTRVMSGDFNLRYHATLSQRIANNNFYIEAVDLIGDGLTYSIGSATAITVTIPSNPFTSSNVGQSMFIGAISGTGTYVSGRYPIASVSGNNVTFTVSGFAVGTGTCSLFGWNYHQILYTATTATQASYDTQRNGWAPGYTVATINTTTSGHVGTLAASNATAVYSDQTGASSTTLELIQRASRVRSIPDMKVPLYVQIRSANGTTNPASTTTFTIGYIEMNSQSSSAVTVANIAPQSKNVALPVDIVTTATIAGTVTSNIGTVGVTATSLAKAEDASASNGDTGIAIWGVRGDTLAAATSTTGDYSQLTTDVSGILMTAGAPRLLKARQNTTITTTAETTIVTAIASTFNDLYGLVLANTSATATEVTIRDVAAGSVQVSFIVPAGETRGFMVPVDSALTQSTVNTAWTAQLGTAVTSLKVTALYVKRI